MAAAGSCGLWPGMTSWRTDSRDTRGWCVDRLGDLRWLGLIELEGRDFRFREEEEDEEEEDEEEEEEEGKPGAAAPWEALGVPPGSGEEEDTAAGDRGREAPFTRSAMTSSDKSCGAP